MKKQLNTESITNELAGASAFFPRPTPPPDARSKADAAARRPGTAQTEPPAAAPRPGADSRHDETALPAVPEPPASKHTSPKASTLARYQDSVIETIRKAVKHPGREVTFVRLTPAEKGQLA